MSQKIRLLSSVQAEIVDPVHLWLDPLGRPWGCKLLDDNRKEIENVTWAMVHLDPNGDIEPAAKPHRSEHGYIQLMVVLPPYGERIYVMCRLGTVSVLARQREEGYISPTGGNA